MAEGRLVRARAATYAGTVLPALRQGSERILAGANASAPPRRGRTGKLPRVIGWRG